VIFIQRKTGESVVFGDDIIVTVIEIRGDKVWVGVERSIEGAVQRREVYEAICHQGQERAFVALDPRREAKVDHSRISGIGLVPSLRANLQSRVGVYHPNAEWHERR